GTIVKMEHGGIVLSASWFIDFKEDGKELVKIRTDKGTFPTTIRRLIVATKQSKTVIIKYKPRKSVWDLSRIIEKVTFVKKI
ncbi:MAG: hypothetical protein ACTSPI_17300, partial [Candidatus Heimdallarchaeaceae archaeon]